MPRAATVTALLGLAGTVLLGACSDESAGERVCDDRSELREQVQDVMDDVAAGNLGDARDGLDDVRQGYDELRSSVGDLAADERDELQPQVDELESQIAALGDAESADDLSATASQAVDSAKSILRQVGATLDC